jgi:hypothetical protein
MEHDDEMIDTIELTPEGFRAAHERVARAAERLAELEAQQMRIGTQRVSIVGGDVTRLINQRVKRETNKYV